MSAVINSSESLFEDVIAKAWSSLLKQDFNQAMLYAKQASVIGPDLPETAHILGLLASRDDRSDIAIPLLEKALASGKTERRLRDIAEAQLVAGNASLALPYLEQSLQDFGASAEVYGLMAAIYVALDKYSLAAELAEQAIALKPYLMAWDGTLSFCHLIQQDFKRGFQAYTGRSQNLAAGSRAPVFNFSQPAELWVKNEQGPGDTIFYARFAVKLAELGWKIHLETDKKTKTLLRDTGVFASVKDAISVPASAFWLNMGDLPLAAIQSGASVTPQPIVLHAEVCRVEKIRNKLAKIGPAPYIAVTWRAGARGSKQRAGLRMYDKLVTPSALGKILKNVNATVVSIQRVPDNQEQLEFKAGLERDFANFSYYNDNLQDMLALLSIVDEYIAVPNTNVHLRASLGLSAHVLVNRPYQDWRWLAEGSRSPWYPNTHIYRQDSNQSWHSAFDQLEHHIKQKFASAEYVTTSISKLDQLLDAANHQLEIGWQALNMGDVATAIQSAQSVIKMAAAQNPPQENANALHLLGWAAMRDLKIELAIGVLQHATELVPTDGRIVGDYVRVLAADKQLDAAIVVATEALSQQNMSNLSGVYYGRAAAFLQQNKYAEAIKDYDSCSRINPNRLDAQEYCGMAELKFGNTRNGFKKLTARKVAKRDELLNDWCCPRLTKDHAGTRVLIKRDMGLGDELTFLRYLPWLTKAGIQVDYWGGNKLVPILKRMGYCHQVFSDIDIAPDAKQYGLSFIVNDLPVATELIGAPEIAPPLPLTAKKELIKKWRAWLNSCGPAPYIGVTWRAGASATGVASVFSKLAKSIPPQRLAKSLSKLSGTFISLQRNARTDEVNAFEATLQAPLYDVAALTDDLEDYLALLSLLDENVGVSNTNMHLRAGLGLGSRVLVQNPGGDWRWGFEGNKSDWFTQSNVYRQQLDEDWAVGLDHLRADMLKKYGKHSQEILAQRIPKQHVNLNKRCIWLSAGQLKDSKTGKTSDMASTRYRVLMPMAELTKRGWQCEFVNEGISQIMGGWGSAVPQSGDVIIISKVFTEHAITLAKDAKARGAEVIVDFCDDFFNHEKRGSLQRGLISVADKVIASTESMAEAIKRQGCQVSTIITDPVEVTNGNIRFQPKDTLKLLWFGHAVNLDTLAQFLPQLAAYAQSQPVSLNIVTTLPSGVNDLTKFVPHGLVVTYTPWSVEVTEQSLQECDLVIIPTLTTDSKKVKSPNRLLESIWAGRFVVAGVLPAYMPFGNSAWIGNDLIEGLNWAVKNPKEVEKRIAQGQKDITENFSIAAISDMWEKAILSSSETEFRTLDMPVSVDQSPRRLNLGCGDKILPGYVNVDVVANRAGKAPDVLCDLHHLEPFVDGSVDEILSVHVVEHFWRWEVLAILKEWVRVLKPGGKMILECPNLKSACEEFLRNPEAAAFGGLEGQRSMWVFYGDPRWKDPYMVHRWGYTPDSLARLMTEAGLINAHQEPAQYKLREPRDMRVVAVKPLNTNLAV